jgi:adenylate kinase family enzyme
MRRVIIMGPSGSGKSTLARRLGALHGLAVFHLDHAYWRPGWSPAPPEAFRAEVERIAALPAWVMDGNYGTMLAPRLARADTVVFLDLPPRVYLPRVLRRTLVGAVLGRTQAPGCRERLNAAFIRYVLTWRRERRDRDLALLDGFRGMVLVPKSEAEVRRVTDDLLRVERRSDIHHGCDVW